MGSLREGKLFRVQLYEFACESLAASTEEVDPYLKIDFDNFKLFKSNVEQNTRNPEWSFKAGFQYEISYLEKLKTRSLRLQCFNRTNSQCLGEASIDLHTIACGPSHFKLTLRDTAGEAAGLLRFCCVMKMISPDFSIIFQELRLTMLGCPASASILISCSLPEAEHRSIQVPHSREGAWSGPFVLALETSLADVLKAPHLEHLSFVVLDETSVRQGEALLEFRKAFNTKPDSRVNFKVPVTFTCTEGSSEWAQEPMGAVGELEGTLLYRNLPVFAQMSGGVCVDGQVDGGFWLYEGLPFPQSMLHPPPLLQEHLGVRGDAIAQPEGEDGEINFDDIDDVWFVEAIEKIDLPPPWEKRRVRAAGDRPGRMYFLDPRSKRTTWKDPRFLPDSWDQRVDPATGKVYFQYHRTRQTTYVDPRSCPLGWEMRLSKDGEIYFAFLPAMRTTLIDPRGLPDNMDAALDDLGRMYFKLHEAQSTTWEDPRAGQQEVTLTKWRQAQSTRWWKEQVWREIEEITRRKDLDEKSEIDQTEPIFERGTSS